MEDDLILFKMKDELNVFLQKKYDLNILKMEDDLNKNAIFTNSTALIVEGNITNKQQPKIDWRNSKKLPISTLIGCDIIVN